MKIYKLYKLAKAVLLLTSIHANDSSLGNEVRSLIHKLKL